MNTLRGPSRFMLRNAMAYYYGGLEVALHTVANGRGRTDDFDPGFTLPLMDEKVAEFLAPSDVAFAELGEYAGKRLVLLDLMGNPRTRTTKTMASLLIVARAVHYIQATDERVMILSPSSGNKATALRDAVLRAIEAGLVEPEQLQIVVAVPRNSGRKLWSSPLNENDDLRRRNPVVVYDKTDGAEVKAVMRAVVSEHGEELRQLNGVNLWYTLDIDNYKPADAIRAFFEREYLPLEAGRRRLHVHAVSSAYGLLGHNLGRTLTNPTGASAGAPAYFLVQHLGTPDMVLCLYTGSYSRDGLPQYEYDPAAGVFRQDADPRFPAVTLDPEEMLDATFYTHQPPTCEEMNAIIGEQGGGGIVVSLHECLTRYAEIRALLRSSHVDPPADPRKLCEWSLVMALTGALNAIDRGLVDADELVVHGTGSYSQDDFEPVPPHHVRPARSVRDVHAIVEEAVEIDASEPLAAEVATSRVYAG
jgi:hypothetical protein